MMQGPHASTTDIGNDGQPVEQQLRCGCVAQHSLKQPLTSRNRTPAPALPPAASAATIGHRTARRTLTRTRWGGRRRAVVGWQRRNCHCRRWQRWRVVGRRSWDTNWTRRWRLIRRRHRHSHWRRQRRWLAVRRQWRTPWRCADDDDRWAEAAGERASCGCVTGGLVVAATTRVSWCRGGKIDRWARRREEDLTTGIGFGDATVSFSVSHLATVT